MELIISPKGIVRGMYDETIHLPCLGTTEIRRASCVEPDSSGQWNADLSPVNGPKLGPFTCRSRALDAEIAWLRRHWLTPTPSNVTLLLARPHSFTKGIPMEKGVGSFLMVLIVVLAFGGCTDMRCAIDRSSRTQGDDLTGPVIKGNPKETDAKTVSLAHLRTGASGHRLHIWSFGPGGG
jgi:hypothetical protein